MPNPRVYIETTVVSAYHDSRTPERMAMTVEFWNSRIETHDFFVSSLVVFEIGNPPDFKRKQEMQSLIAGITVLEADEESSLLAEEYIGRGIVPARYVTDAEHVAIASVNRMDYLCSWNFRHLVKVNTRREVNLLNALKGYGPLEIIAPPEL